MDNIFCSSPPCRTGSCSWRTPEIPLGPVTVLNAFWHWTERKISEKSLIASFQIIPDHHIRFMSQWGAKSANSRQIDKHASGIAGSWLFSAFLASCLLSLSPVPCIKGGNSLFQPKFTWWPAQLLPSFQDIWGDQLAHEKSHHENWSKNDQKLQPWKRSFRIQNCGDAGDA